MFSRDITLKTVPVKSIRPTQMTVGFREVQLKRQGWKARREDKRPEFIEGHMIPIVVGPKDRFYAIDHHHLIRALSEEGVEGVLTTTVAHLNNLTKSAFWNFMEHRGWCRPFDEKGQRCPYEDMPKEIGLLTDDPYRSLAGELRRAGGFSKDTTPFSEFLWADFFRPRLSVKALRSDFDAQISKAVDLARSEDANYLPGWCGPCD